MQNAKTQIQSEEDDESALRQIEPYFLCEPMLGTPDAARFDALAEVLEAYEAKHWLIAGSVRKP